MFYCVDLCLLCGLFGFQSLREAQWCVICLPSRLSWIGTGAQLSEQSN